MIFLLPLSFQTRPHLYVCFRPKLQSINIFEEITLIIPLKRMCLNREFSKEISVPGPRHTRRSHAELRKPRENPDIPREGQRRGRRNEEFAVRAQDLERLGEFYEILPVKNVFDKSEITTK